MFGRALLFALTIQISAFAGAVTYNYTGNPFNGCQVGDCSALTDDTVSLTFASPLAASTTYVWGNSGQSGVAITPLAWTMFNGQDSVSPLVSDPSGTNGSFIFIATDSFGAIGTWVIQGRDQDPGYTGPLPKLTISTGNSLSIFDDDSTSKVVFGFSPQYVGFIDHTPGRWTSAAAATPEPGTIGLALLGGVCLLAVRRR